MKNYIEQKHTPVDYVLSFCTAFFAIGLVIFALSYQGDKQQDVVRTPIQTVLVASSSAPPAPPPPPPEVITPPDPYVPTPKINVPPPPNAIQQISNQKKQNTQKKHKKIEQKKHSPSHSKSASDSQSKSQSTSKSNLHGTANGKSTSGQGDHAAGAVPVNNVRPEYPESAQEENREGAVTASCDIDETGKPENCTILSVKGGNDFAESAMNFLKHSGVRYQPAISNGSPIVEHGHILHLDFTLSDQ